MKFIFIFVGALALVYLFFSYRFVDREFVQMELRYEDADLFFSQEDQVSVGYSSVLPIPYVNVHWTPSFILPKFQSEGRERDYQLGEFVKDEKMKSVTIKFPIQIAGVGAYEATSITFTRNSHGIRSSFLTSWIQEVSADNKENTYLLVRAPVAVAIDKFSNRDLLLRMLNEKIRFSEAPALHDYYLDRTNKLTMGAAYDLNAVENSEKVFKVEELAQADSILSKFQGRTFYGLEGRSLGTAKLFKIQDSGLDVVSLTTKPDQQKAIFSLKYAFNHRKSWLLISTKEKFQSGQETALYYFENNQLTYASAPIIWSSLYELQGRKEVAEKPAPVAIDQILDDFEFLRSRLFKK